MNFVMVRKPSEETISSRLINASNAANMSGKIRHVKEFGFFYETEKPLEGVYYGSGSI